MKNGFHQLELHPSSRDINPFITHWGLRRYRTLNCRTCSASESFHVAIRKLIADMLRICMAYGWMDQDHQRELHRILRRFRKAGVTANGMDPRKIEAQRNATPPSNATEVKSFLGMTNYTSRFIRNYSSKTYFTWGLQEGAEWNWADDHQRCFEDLKNSLLKDNVLRCFDIHSKTKVIVDASPTGPGVMLVQEQELGKDRVIAYASRALNECEKRRE